MLFYSTTVMFDFPALRSFTGEVNYFVLRFSLLLLSLMLPVQLIFVGFSMSKNMVAFLQDSIL